MTTDQNPAPSPEEPTISGWADDRFQPLVDVLERQLEADYDLGASLAVVVDGELCCDVWGGHTDDDRTEAWQADTITNVWSCTKTLTALSALILIDRGLVDPDEKVAAYWPEFGAEGKGDIEVRHLLAHTSGVSGWDRPVTLDDVLDLERSTSMLAAQAPWWEPGSQSGYHALNQGHLVGEVIRRVDGRDLARFVAEEVAGPLGADFTIGSPVENHGRITNVTPPPFVKMEVEGIGRDHPLIKTFTGPVAAATVAHSDPWRAAIIGAANGHGNARSLATIQAVMSNGGTSNGVSLLSPATIDRALQVESDGVDLVLQLPLRFGLGYGLASPDDPLGLTDGRLCYWGGWGGSIVVSDLDNRITMAYVMNRMQAGLLGNDTSKALIAAFNQLR